MPAIAPKSSRSVDKPEATRENLRKSLLSWYDRHGRALPWRTRGGRGDPYRVWLSEIMLQQTTVAAATPYFARFLEKWPTVAALAGASREELLAAWAGLGYYARARNLHAAAQQLARSGFPSDEAGWRALPGVGPYTAAAIAAIALDRPANVVDGNVERVMARFYALEAPLPEAKPALRKLAAALADGARPGDWAQALMDLGATVCTPRAPNCSLCPWRRGCAANAAGAATAYPRRRAGSARPERYGVAFRALRDDGAFWLVRRSDQGLLGGMAALPTTEWRAEAWTRAQALRRAPTAAKWKRVGRVRHVFTHFALTLEVYEARATPKGDGWWGDAVALPSVFKKAATLKSQT
jgi:A/G-specific adenine glycosylase